MEFLATRVSPALTPLESRWSDRVATRPPQGPRDALLVGRGPSGLYTKPQRICKGTLDQGAQFDGVTPCGRRRERRSPAFGNEAPSAQEPQGEIHLRNLCRDLLFG